MVTSLLIEAAEKTPGIYSEIKPYVFQISLNEINAITIDPQNMYYIKSDLIKNIQRIFKDKNIPLSSIQYIEIRENKGFFNE